MLARTRLNYFDQQKEISTQTPYVKEWDALTVRKIRKKMLEQEPVNSLILLEKNIMLSNAH